MELVYIAQEVLQNGAEHAASYRVGQNVLRQLDRALLAVEKCARWAVPPPLEEERPQELVRPLPWVFFFALLIALRVLRESLSLVNLVLGKPPVRSADMVTYIQGKRRYVRTLKYHGGRAMRARGARGGASAYNLRALLELAMCFRRTPNNHAGNNDEVIIVKREPANEAGDAPSATAASETTMERLIEKMMVDLDDESDDDRSKLTNVTSGRSDKSDFTDSELETPMTPQPVEPSAFPDCSTTMAKQNNLATENHVEVESKEVTDPEPIINNNTREATTMFLQHESCGNKVQPKAKVIANGQARKDKQRKKESFSTRIAVPRH